MPKVSGIAKSGQAPRRISAPSATIWKVVFHFASCDTGTETCNPPRNSRRPETAISRSRMTSAGDHCIQPVGRDALWTRTRITAATMILSAIGSRNTPEPARLALDAGDVAVEIVGDPHQAVEREGEP